MNKRILELADQAVEGMMPGPWEIPDEFCEKFAELIVQECISAVEDTNDRHRRDYFADKIRKHFGIEE